MSKYETLSKQLMEQIAQNLEQGLTALPTEAKLSARYGVSRQTVRAALALLKQKGLIESRQGSGSFATGLAPDLSQNRIPILIASSQEYIYPRLLADIRSSLSEKGYQLDVLPTDNHINIERIHLLSLLENPPRGLIVEGTKSALPTPNFDLYERLKTAGTRLLFLHGCSPALSDEVCIKDDNYYGGYLLAGHLTALGHTRIAGLFKLDDAQGPERYLGAACCLRDLGLTLADENVGWFVSSDLEALQKKQDTSFLALYCKERLSDCTAVICYNDEIAYWLIKELNYRNLRVPEDVSVVCFDNTYLSELSAVQITSLSHQRHEMGVAAAEMLLNLMRSLAAPSRKLPWKLVEKRSCTVCPQVP